MREGKQSHRCYEKTALITQGGFASFCPALLPVRGILTMKPAHCWAGSLKINDADIMPEVLQLAVPAPIVLQKVRHIA